MQVKTCKKTLEIKVSLDFFYFVLIPVILHFLPFFRRGLENLSNSSVFLKSRPALNEPSLYSLYTFLQEPKNNSRKPLALSSIIIFAIVEIPHFDQYMPRHFILYVIFLCCDSMIPIPRFERFLR